MQATNGLPPLIIGVTGHRILADEELLVAGIDQALDLVQNAYGPRPWRILTALAEGADRLVTRRVLLWPGARLLAALPLPPDDYVQDFHHAESRAEFRALLNQAVAVVEMPPAPRRTAAYVAAGRYVADCCDVLLAIWDGRDAQGEGGTGDIVARARQRGCPILVVRAGNRVHGTLTPTSLGEEQGRVLCEQLPTRAPAAR